MPIFCSKIDIFDEISDGYVINFDPKNESNLISQLEDNLFNESKLDELSLKCFNKSKNLHGKKMLLIQ